MLKGSTNKIKIYFQVMFSLVLPSSLLSFPNQLALILGNPGATSRDDTIFFG